MILGAWLLCAWVLWSWHDPSPVPTYWYRGAFDTKKECEAKSLDEEWDMAKDGIHSMRYMCLPAALGRPR